MIDKPELHELYLPYKLDTVSISPHKLCNNTDGHIPKIRSMEGRLLVDLIGLIASVISLPVVVHLDTLRMTPLPAARDWGK